MKENKKLWFKRKTYGWGWTPTTWQGWVVVAVYVFLILPIFFYSDNDSHSVSDTLLSSVLPFIILTAGLIFICYKKGEKPRWQWGKNSMIEVEKKFNPTDEQLNAMLVGAEFMGEKENVDVYYDTPEFYYYKKGMRLRKRNNNYELKIEMANFEANATDHSEEINNEKDILARLGFNVNDNLENVIKEKMEILCSIKTKRKTYHKGDFIIDIDETDFGYNVVEIETMVEDKSQLKQAEENIIVFAHSFGFSLDKLPGKVSECLRRARPEVYKALYSDN